MRIALFTDGIFPYVIGGMQKHSFNLVKYFAKNRVHVGLYHCNQSRHDITRLEFFSEDEKKYISSHVLDFPSMGNFPGHYLRESFEYSHRIFKRFSENPDVDFIYAKGFTAWKLISEKNKGYKCAPVGVNFHGYEMFQKPASFSQTLEQLFLFRKPVLFNITHADHVFSYGGRISNLILQLGIPRSKIIESPAGIESDWIVSEIRPSESKRKFIFIGRYERRKGIEELAKALDDIPSNGNLEFSFVGDIPPANRIKSPNVTYPGKVTEAGELKKILSAQDVLVCPSYSEGMPNVILEAMACGLAVIASDVGAVNLLVSPENGWLIPPGNKEKLRKVIVLAQETSGSLLDEMKRCSKSLVKKYVWEDIMVHLIQDLEQRIHLG